MNITFHELTLPLFVAGELDIIMNSTESAEREGRLQLLISLMYDAVSYEFSEILKGYAAWVREIELGMRSSKWWTTY